MLMIGGRNYRAYFEKRNEVTYYPITELYAADISVPKSEDLIIFMGSLELSGRYRNSVNNVSNIMLAKNLNKLKNKKIIFISSSAVYGLSSVEEAFTSSCQLYGMGNYALEKINLEALLSTITNRLVILRPSGFFGEICGYKPRSFLNSLSETISSGLSKNYDIEFAGLQLRDFTHVQDQCIVFNIFVRSKRLQSNVITLQALNQ